LEGAAGVRNAGTIDADEFARLEAKALS